MNKKGYIYLGLAILFFSTMEIASKSIVNDFHPIQMNFLRYFVGAISLLPFTVNHMAKNHIKLGINDIVTLSLLGILTVPISMSLFQVSLLYTKASVLAVIISSNALFVAPFSYFILKEKIDKFVIVSLIFGIAGVIIIANPSSSIGSKDLTGILYGAGSAITFALFTVLGKRTISKFGGLILNNFVFLSGALVMLPFMLLVNIPVFSGINTSNLFPILYLGIGVTTGGYIFLFKGLSILPANRGSFVFFIKPVLAGTLAFLFLGESITFNLILGTLFILSGMLFVIVPKSKTSKIELKG